MAENNRTIVDKILNSALRNGMGHFILREYKQLNEIDYLQEIENTINRNKPPNRKIRITDEAVALREADVQTWFNILLKHWDDIFAGYFKGSERSYAFELKDARNAWAHTDQLFTNGEAYRIADTATRLLEAIGATKDAEFTNNIAQELLRPPAPPAPVTMTKQYAPPREAPAVSKFGIKPLWAGWQDRETVIGFSPRAYEKWKTSIHPGTRMLIYETTVQRPGSRFRSAKGIIGEVEVVEGFGKNIGVATPTIEHNFPLSIKVLRGRASVAPIPLTQVRAILNNPKFPYQGVAWYPLEESVYREFLKIWGVR